MNNLISLLEEADPPDLYGARRWYQKAADAGEASAMNNLGLVHEPNGPRNSSFCVTHRATAGSTRKTCFRDRLNLSWDGSTIRRQT
jgi:TPR repeat protein